MYETINCPLYQTYSAFFLLSVEVKQYMSGKIALPRLTPVDIFSHVRAARKQDIHILQLLGDIRDGQEEKGKKGFLL